MDTFNTFFAILIVINAALVTCRDTNIGDHETDVFFKSNTKEMLDQPLTFNDTLPVWLKGTLIRNGVGRFEVGPRSLTNALDAYAKLASWKFNGGGEAKFSTKMMYTNSYVESLQKNTVAPYLMLDGVVPPFNKIEEAEAFKNGPDNVNVNIIRMINNDDINKKSQFVAVSDYWQVYEINPYNLSTIGRINAPIPGKSHFGPLILLSSAHILPEYNSTAQITFGTLASVIPNEKCLMKVVRIQAAGHRELIAELELDKVSYMHSFGVSKNYAVIFATPFYVDPAGMFINFRAMDAFKWEPNDPTTVYVVHLKTGKVITMKTETMFFLHVANTFEINDNEIAIDIAVYKNVSNFKNLELSFLRNKTQRARPLQPVLKRYFLNLEFNTVVVKAFPPSQSVPFAGKLDFPTINENFRYKNYCYVYGIVYSYDDEDWFHMALVKKDVCTGLGDKEWHVYDHFFDEAYFVPRPGGVEEDDGVLLLPILDNGNQITNITVFDAKDLSIISSSVLPINIPFGTHGKFYDDIF